MGQRERERERVSPWSDYIEVNRVVARLGLPIPRWRGSGVHGPIKVPFGRTPTRLEAISCTISLGVGNTHKTAKCAEKQFKENKKQKTKRKIMNGWNFQEWLFSIVPTFIWSFSDCYYIVKKLWSIILLMIFDTEHFCSVFFLCRIRSNRVW